MKEILAILFMIILVISSFSTYAASSATSGDYSDDDSDDTSENGEDTTSNKVDCETSAYPTARDRIRCRIENKGNVKVTEQSRVPEACRRLAASTASGRITLAQCRELYSKLTQDNNCYRPAITGTELARCLHTTADFRRNIPLAQQDKDDIRRYIVGLMYAMEYRVEKAQEMDKLTVDEAAELLDLITEAKHRVMSGEYTKADVKTAWKVVKDKWNEAYG